MHDFSFFCSIRFYLDENIIYRSSFKGKSIDTHKKYEAFNDLSRDPKLWQPWLSFILFIYHQNTQSMEGANMYASHPIYYYHHPFLHPYLQYCDYLGQVYTGSLNLNKIQNKEPSSIKIEESTEKIAYQVSLEASKVQQASANQFRLKKKSSLETRSRGSIQYILPKRGEKIINKQFTQQKQNRNVYSNILRNFFRKLNDCSRTRQLLNTIITRRKLKLTANDFLDHLKRLKINHSKYLRFKKLRHLFNDNPSSEYSMMFRILLQHYTKGELLIQTLTSKKIGRWSIYLHLKGKRQIKNKLY